MKPKLLVILGPTATGKTDIGLELARKLNGEVISADSRQVYTGLDIGSGKEPGRDSVFEKKERFWTIDGVKVWLYDVLSPANQYTVWDYIHDASQKVEEISREKKLPVIVGGSGLYIRALLNGLENIESSRDENLRTELENSDLESLQKKILSLSPSVYKSLNNSELNNKRRLIRKIELLSSPAFASKSFVGLSKTFDVLKIGITCPKAVLDQRIDVRVDKRMKKGMIDEAVRLYNAGLSPERMKQLGLEYGVLADFLEGKFKDPAEMAEYLKVKIHQFAKRQLTWFKKEEDVFWFDLTKPDYPEKVEKQVLDWYNA